MKLGTAVAISASFAFANFDACKFNFGRTWSDQFNASTSFAGQGLSHLAIWLGDNAQYNQYWEGDLVKAAKANDLTPVFYAYVIAEFGKDNGLQDCDMGSPNHCTDGARMIRSYWSQILQRYSNYAAGVASDYGTDKTTLWLIEPDFLQYSVTGDQLDQHYAQNGGGIPDAELAGRYFNEIVSAIKQHLPNAKIAVDISPWMNDLLEGWYANFDQSKVDYLFNSGGRTQGDQARIRNDNNNLITWARASAAMGGKKIIADDGYGVGGSSNSDYLDWMNASNLQNRIADGVIGLTIQDPHQSYLTFAAANNNLSTGCGTGNSSSSSSPGSSSSSDVSSSSVAPSSSSIASSSSVQSSSSSLPSSSSVSSSSSAEAGEWWAINADLSAAHPGGVTASQGSQWGDNRQLFIGMGDVETGTAYELTFEAAKASGGADMNLNFLLGSYCSDVLTLNGGVAGTATCTFVALSNESVVLQLIIPAERWETVQISNLSLIASPVSSSSAASSSSSDVSSSSVASSSSSESSSSSVLSSSSSDVSSSSVSSSSSSDVSSSSVSSSSSSDVSSSSVASSSSSDVSSSSVASSSSSDVSSSSVSSSSSSDVSSSSVSSSSSSDVSSSSVSSSSSSDVSSSSVSSSSSSGVSSSSVASSSSSDVSSSSSDVSSSSVSSSSSSDVSSSSVSSSSSSSPLSIIAATQATQMLRIHLRNGQIQNWRLPARASVELYNINGQQVLPRIQSRMLDMNSLPAGLYVIRARSGSWRESLPLDNR